MDRRGKLPGEVPLLMDHLYHLLLPVEESFLFSYISLWKEESGLVTKEHSKYINVAKAEIE